MFNCLLIFSIIHSAFAASYIPSYLEGTPVAASVVEFVPHGDYRGLPVYRITFSIDAPDGRKEGQVHRQYQEFSRLHDLMSRIFWFNKPWVLPSAEQASVASLNSMMKSVMGNSRLVASTAVHDFLGINWKAQGVDWFKDFASFMYMVTLARVPDFPPEYVRIETEEDALSPETPFELYVYITAFRALQNGLSEYLEFFNNYTLLTPAFKGAADDSDVWPPAATQPIKMPYHYTKTFVHFLPGGYTNGHTVRISYCGYSKFNFLKETELRKWIGKVHAGRNPKRILDLGTGACFSALVYAEMYPDAEVVGIDLAAPYIRFCRMWAARRNVTNVKFYQDNGEATHFPDNHFDLVHFAYVLHEMPEENAEIVLKEIQRILKPNGVLSGFEVPFLTNVVTRETIILSQTWGYSWNTTGNHGPEPYTREYQRGTQLPNMIQSVGFKNMIEYENSIFDAVYIAEK